MKKFVLVRGTDTGMLYLYDRVTYTYMVKHNKLQYGLVLEFVVDNDDREVLEGFQKLVNKDLMRED